MTRLRLLLRRRPWLAWAIVLAALVVRIAVPPGMMPGGRTALMPCSGEMAAGTPPVTAMPGMAMPAAAMPSIAMPGMAMPATAVLATAVPAMPGMAIAAKDSASPHAPHNDAAPHDAPCAYSGLLTAADVTGDTLPVLAPMPRGEPALRLTSLVPVAMSAPQLWPPRRGPPVAVSA